MKKLTFSDRTNLLADYAMGQPVSTLAKTYGLHKDYVRRVAMLAGVKHGADAYSPHTKAAVPDAALADPERPAEAPAFTRRCANKDCIERFVPVNSQHRFHETACGASTNLWTWDEVLREEGSLLPSSNTFDLAKRAFGQKNRVLRQLQERTSLNEYIANEVRTYYEDNPEYRWPSVPKVKSDPPMRPSRGERVVLVQLSDWQIGKLEEGIGVDEMRVRVERIKGAVRSVVERQRAAGYSVKKVVNSWGGDMIEGCVPAGSLVDTQNGPKPIETIVAGDLVWAHSDSGFALRRVEAAEMTGIDRIYTIRSTERTIRANAEHPILVRRRHETSGDPRPSRHRFEVRHEYVRAADIRVGDLLCISDALPDVGESLLPVEMFEFLGFFTGDGCLTRGKKTPNGVYLSHESGAPYMGHYAAVCSRLFSNEKGPVKVGLNESGSRFHSTLAAKLLVDLGVDHPARKKRIPEFVFRASLEQRRAYLRGYLDADGTVNTLGQIVYASVNRDLMEDVRHLAISVGLLASRVKSQDRTCPLPQGGSMESTIYTVNCGSPDLNATIGSHTPKYIERWAAKAGTRRVRQYPVCDKGRIIEPPAGTRYSKVQEVSLSELAEPVYNLTVADDHTYIVDGVVTHNCYIYGGQNVNGLDRTGNTHRLVTQVRVAATWMAELAMDEASYVEEVQNYDVPGNHGRTNGRNDFSDPKDNFDSLAAYIAEILTAQESRISWEHYDDWWGSFDILGHRFVSFHGDQWRGPFQKLEELLPKWVTGNVFGSLARPEVVLTHHRHDLATLRVGGIQVVQNGTIDGGSGWYLRAFGKSSPPAQMIHVVSERRATESLWPVDFS